MQNEKNTHTHKHTHTSTKMKRKGKKQKKKQNLFRTWKYSFQFIISIITEQMISLDDFVVVYCLCVYIIYNVHVYLWVFKWCYIVKRRKMKRKKNMKRNSGLFNSHHFAWWHSFKIVVDKFYVPFTYLNNIYHYTCLSYKSVTMVSTKTLLREKRKEIIIIFFLLLFTHK